MPDEEHATDADIIPRGLLLGVGAIAALGIGTLASAFAVPAAAAATDPSTTHRSRRITTT